MMMKMMKMMKMMNKMRGQPSEMGLAE